MKNGKMTQIPFTMPPSDPEFPTPPWRYRNTEALVATFETDYDAIAEIIPAELELDDTPTGIFMVMDIPFTPLGVYRECAIAINVKYQGTPYLYATHLYLNNDVPFTAGREFLGFPKKIAVLDYQKSFNQVTFSINRPAPHKLIECTVTPEKNLPADAWANVDFLTYKAIPSCVEGKMDVAQICRSSFAFFPITGTDGICELWSGPASLEFHGTADDRLDRIPIKKITGGMFGTFNAHISYGDVLIDYLKK